MPLHIRAHLLLLLACLSLTPGHAQDPSADDMRSLDGQVQEIKSDVLSIAAELNNLEERLLYPSNTQLAVFVALPHDESMRLDAVKLEVDGAMATHHIYSFKELEALQKGGVQRIYTGNVPTGEHQLTVTMLAKLANGDDIVKSGSFSFTKDVGPKALGVTLSGSGPGDAGIRIGDW